MVGGRENLTLKKVLQFSVSSTGFALHWNELQRKSPKPLSPKPHSLKKCISWPSAFSLLSLFTNCLNQMTSRGTEWRRKLGWHSVPGGARGAHCHLQFIIGSTAATQEFNVCRLPWVGPGTTSRCSWWEGLKLSGISLWSSWSDFQNCPSIRAWMDELDSYQNFWGRAPFSLMSKAIPGGRKGFYLSITS